MGMPTDTGMPAAAAATRPAHLAAASKTAELCAAADGAAAHGMLEGAGQANGAGGDVGGGAAAALDPRRTSWRRRRPRPLSPRLLPCQSHTCCLWIAMAQEQAVQAFQHLPLGDEVLAAAQVEALQAQNAALMARTSRLLRANAWLIASHREVLEALADGTPEEQERAAEGEMEVRRLVERMEQATMR